MKIAGFFPGQGSQSLGMGKDFYENFPLFKQTIEEASDSLNQNLKKLLFEGPAEDLTLTENAQPAILAVSTGCFRVAKSELGIQTDIHLGHSLGEYSALACAESIPYSAAVQWVRLRGQAMQQAVPVGVGTMSAVLGASDEDVIAWCKEATASAIAASENLPKSTVATNMSHETIVEPANFNSPGQVVVSGSVDAVEALENLIKAKGIRGVMAKRLTVSAPFHCKLMKPARDQMEKLFTQVAPAKKGTVPYIANVTAAITREADSIFPLLVQQVVHPVLWTKSIETLMAVGVNRAYEFGPGKVLQGLAKRIAKAKEIEFEVTPIFDVESLKAATIS